jgi:DnaJ-class molecular chaperone
MWAAESTVQIVGSHSKKENCSACGGSGKQKIGSNGHVTEVNCTVCHGSGKV